MPSFLEAPPNLPEMAETLVTLGASLDGPVAFPQGEHDDLFDGLQRMVEGTTSYATARAERYAPIPRW